MNILVLFLVSLAGCSFDPIPKPTDDELPSGLNPIEEIHHDVLRGSTMLRIDYVGSRCPNLSSGIQDPCEIIAIEVKLDSEKISEVTLLSGTEESIRYEKKDAPEAFESLLKKLRTLELIEGSQEDHQCGIASLHSLEVHRGSKVEEYFEYGPECSREKDELRGISSAYGLIDEFFKNRPDKESGR